MIQMFTRALDDEHSRLAAMVPVAEGVIQAVDGLKLTPFLQPLVAPLVNLCQSGKTLLATNTSAALITQVEAQLTGAFGAGFDAQKAHITSLIPAASSLCMSTAANLSIAMFPLHQDVLQRLAPLATLGPAASKACLSLLGTYGKPWITCMASLAPAELTVLTTRCTYTDVQTAIRKRVTADNIGDLSKVVKVAINPAVDWDVACGNIHSFGYAGIALPPNVTALTWEPFGQWWVPGALATSSMETDLACIKHLEHELRPDISQAAIEVYFADMAAACAQACAQWSAAKKPQEFKATPIQLHGATWTIMVRNRYGRPLVYHVDSGYEKSWWKSQK
jgi:hypothetical protein